MLYDTLKHGFLALLIASVALLGTPAAFAGHNQGGGGGGGGGGGSGGGGNNTGNTNGGSTLAITSTTVVVLTVLGGGVTLLIVLLNNSGGDSEEAKLRFIQKRATGLEQDLTLGSGEAVADLANAFRVDTEHRDAFGEMLRDRRDQLMPLLNREKLDRERAATFFEVVVRGMQSHPELREELEDVRATASNGG